MIETIEQIIKEQKLDRKSRHRTKIYQRAYLYSVLYNQGINSIQIGRMFNRDHATVLHGIKIHKMFIKNDKLYHEAIKLIVMHLDGVKEPVCIYQDIYGCKGYKMLNLIKTRIANNYY
jgi:hypothetical protein